MKLMYNYYSLRAELDRKTISMFVKDHDIFILPTLDGNIIGTVSGFGYTTLIVEGQKNYSGECEFFDISYQELLTDLIPNKKIKFIRKEIWLSLSLEHFSQILKNGSFFKE